MADNNRYITTVQWILRGERGRVINTRHFESCHDAYAFVDTSIRDVKDRDGNLVKRGIAEWFCLSHSINSMIRTGVTYTHMDRI